MRALNPKTTGTSATARSTPATAGPAKKPTDSIVLDATLAAVSSAGWVASWGRSAICAGRKAVAAMAVATPRA